MIYICESFIICLLDLFSKHHINNTLKRGEKRELLPEKLYFINTKNTGIAYNRLEKRPNAVKIITSFITALFGMFFFGLIGDKNASEYLKMGSVMAFGGALGNMIDRLKNGCVTDFIYIKAVKKFPIFNLADVFILFGAVIMAFSDIFKH